MAPSATAQSHTKVSSEDKTSAFGCKAIDTITPVLTPALLASGPPLASSADLRRYTLLHDFDRKPWASWFRAAGLGDIAAQTGPIYPDGAQSIQAAKLGHGVALCDLLLDSDDLRPGHLVRPFEMEVPYGAYWLVVPDFQRLSRPAKMFAKWITEEVAAEKEG